METFQFILMVTGALSWIFLIFTVAMIALGRIQFGEDVEKDSNG